MKAYKITNNGKCRNQLYEVGKTYQIKGDLIMCKNGLHFCKNPDDLFTYYPYQKNITKIFEIEVLGECIDDYDKSVTDKLKVIREIPLNEYNDLFKNYQFDEKNNLTYSKNCDGYEYWIKYDNNGNLIHHKSSNGFEKWKEYDDNGNIIHFKNSDGFEEWKEYDNNDKIIHYKNSNYYQYWIKYDKDNLIHYKNSRGYEYWKEYDNSGNQISFKDSNNNEYDNNGNLKY